MRKYFALLIILGFLVLPVIAVEVVIEKRNDYYMLVAYSSQPISISGYVAQLNYTQDMNVIQVDSVEPYLTFSNIQNDKSYTRIASATGGIEKPSSTVNLAKIIADEGFNPEIFVEELYDVDLNLIIGVTQVSKILMDPIPGYPAESYQPSQSQEKTTPPEVRVSWTAPEHAIISGTIPIVSPVTEPEADEMIADDVDGETGVQPSGTNEESSHLPTAIDPLLDPARQTEQEQIPSEGSPLSFITIIVGLSIVMLMCKRGL